MRYLVRQPFGIIFAVFQGLFTPRSQQGKQGPIDTQKDVVEHDDGQAPESVRTRVCERGCVINGYMIGCVECYH